MIKYRVVIINDCGDIVDGFDLTREEYMERLKREPQDLITFRWWDEHDKEHKHTCGPMSLKEDDKQHNLYYQIHSMSGQEYADMLLKKADALRGEGR